MSPHSSPHADPRKIMYNSCSSRYARQVLKYMCVCERERESERVRESESESERE